MDHLKKRRFFDCASVLMLTPRGSVPHGSLCALLLLAWIFRLQLFGFPSYVLFDQQNVNLFAGGSAPLCGNGPPPPWVSSVRVRRSADVISEAWPEAVAVRLFGGYTFSDMDAGPPGSCGNGQRLEFSACGHETRDRQCRSLGGWEVGLVFLFFGVLGGLFGSSFGVASFVGCYREVPIFAGPQKNDRLFHISGAQLGTA